MKIEHMITVVSLITAIAGASYFIDDRYASASDFNEQIIYTTNYHTEKEIERAQDKLEGLLMIPALQRRPWQNSEIIRLQNLIAKLIRKLG